jgi:hypothetical protein
MTHVVCLSEDMEAEKLNHKKIAFSTFALDVGCHRYVQRRFADDVNLVG